MTESLSSDWKTVAHPQKIRHIAIAAHPKLVQARLEAERIASFLESKDLGATCGYLYEDVLSNGVERGEFDLWITLGGDGTMLRSGHLCAPYDIPILGINLGSLGFLIEVQREEWRDALTRVLEGDFWIEPRMMLRAEQWRDEEMLGFWEVVNEATVSRAEIIRPVKLKTSVDGRYLTTYVADALIAATPTGSTAYALAAGGPILPPELRNILIVPVAPHLSVDRAIVLAEGSFVSILVNTDHKAALSVDGKEPVALQDGDEVKVRASDHTVRFVRLRDPGYFYRNLTSRMNAYIGAEKEQ